MSYEYSVTSGRLEIPNPYRIDNVGLFVTGAVSAAAGLWLLVIDRQALANGNGLKGVSIGLVLLAAGLGSIGRALSQLRYFFGRGRPRDLTDSWPKSTAVNAISDNLRQGALRYAEPRGPISGLVHKLFESLIFAPQRVRYATETQCSNLLLTVAFLLGLITTYSLYANTAVRAFVALAFGAMAQLTLLTPFVKRDATYEKARAGIPLIILIIAIPILLPPVLARLSSLLPNLAPFGIGATVLVSLAILLAAQVLFFLALTRQLARPPSINMACEQRRLVINANPSKLFEELERVLQSRWTESIPNRQYYRRNPPEQLDHNSGSFRADLIEESQPLPTGPSQPPSLQELLTGAATRWLSTLTLLGAATQSAAVIAALRCGTLTTTDPSWVRTFVLAVVLALTGQYCRLSARELWGRVNFESQLLWFELLGSYETANVQIGNQLTTGMSSVKRVINVESMTLRVWAADIDTVIFGKDDVRDWIGMRGRVDLARLLADHLEDFARRAPSIVVPQGPTDLERLNAISQIQRHLGTAPAVAALPTALGGPVAAAETKPSLTQPTAISQCPNATCATPAPAGALFCSACGTRLVPAA